MSQVYDAHRSAADSLICEALANTDSPTEKLDILRAHQDALAAFSVVPVAADPVPANDPAPIEDAPAPKKGRKAVAVPMPIDTIIVADATAP